MTEQQQVVFRRKGSRVIYPFTEENAKKANLIPMTVAEAQEEGLLAPRADAKREDPAMVQLRQQNEVLRLKIAELEGVKTGSKPAVKKKRAAKKPEKVEAEVVEEEVAQLSLSDLLKK